MCLSQKTPLPSAKWGASLIPTHSSDPDRPGTAWLVQPGAHSWTRPDISAPGVGGLTLTIVARQCESLVTTLDALLSTPYLLPARIRWCDLGRPAVDSVMQRRKLENAARRALPGFAMPVVLADPSTGLLSNAAELLGPIRGVHVQALSYNERAVLVLDQGDTTPAGVLEAFKHFVEGSDVSRFYGMAKVALEDDWVILRIYEDSCTHCIAELFGTSTTVDQIGEVLRQLEVPQITEDDIVSFIRKGRTP